jgi:hypothetical protein
MIQRTMLLFAFCLIAAHVAGQQRPADVQSEEAIIKALYEVISGAPGEARDWNRFRHLFAESARLIPTRKENDQLVLRPLTPDEYIQLFSSRVAGGFFEKELFARSERYGTVVHRFSTYETRETVNGPITNRGINSIQLFFNGERYFIVSIFWCAESMGFPLPATYLPK